MKLNLGKQYLPIILLVLALPVVVLGTSSWRGDHSLQPGVSGPVDAIVEYDGNLVLGGRMVSAGNLEVNNVVFWNGTNWEHPGDGLNGQVNDLLVFNEKLYAAGSFTQSGEASVSCVAVWTGETWTAIDNNILGTVNKLVVYQNKLVLLGDFTVQGINNCAVWAGDSWSDLGGNLSEPCVDGTVRSGVLWVASDDMHAYDGYGWAEVEFPGTITAVETAGEKLIVGGEDVFQSDAGDVYDCAVWTGEEWVGSSPANGYKIIDLFNTSSNVTYYVASADDDVTFVHSQYRFCKLNGSSWVPIEGDEFSVFGEFTSLGEYQTGIVVGGQFDIVGTTQTSNVVIYNSFWYPVGETASGLGTSGPVYGMSATGNQLLAVGSFGFAGSSQAGGIARFDGFMWDDITVPLINSRTVDSDWYDSSTSLLETGVHFVEEYKGTVYAGGSYSFLSTDGVFYNMAVMGSQNWEPFQTSYFSNPDVEVTGMAIHKDLLYISGGQHNNYNTRLYSWDGEQLTNISSGLSGRVAAISNDGEYLYCALQTDASNINIVRYNCTEWEEFGQVEGTVLSITAKNDVAYISTADGVWSSSGTATRIAQTDGPVYALEFYNGDLIAGGYFYDIDGVECSGLVRLNNGLWASLGDVGVNTDTNSISSEGVGVRSLLAYQGNLMVGGRFFNIDGTIASNLARYNDHDHTAPELTVGIHTNPYAIQFIDIYLTGNDTPLLSNLLEVDVSGEQISLNKLDDEGMFWHGSYTLDLSGEAFEITASAWDQSWETGTITVPLSAMAINGADGGTLTSHDQKANLLFPSGGFDGSCVSIITEGAISTEGSANNIQLLTQTTTGDIVYDFIGPAHLNKPATISFQIDSSQTPEGWYIERTDGTAIESLVDPDNNFVSAQVYELGSFTLKWSSSVESQIADRKFLTLGPAAPNPFNPTTTIEFEIKATQNIVARILDLKGRTVCTLVNGDMPPGSHSLVWDGKEDSGASAASGVYMIQVCTNKGGLVSRKITLAK